jgi:hypothetical protein
MEVQMVKIIQTWVIFQKTMFDCQRLFVYLSIPIWFNSIPIYVYDIL